MLPCLYVCKQFAAVAWARKATVLHVLVFVWSAAVTTHQRTRPLLRPLACAAWLPRPHSLELVHPTVAHRHLHVRRRAQAWGLSLRRRAQVGGGRGPGRGHSTCRLVPAMICCGLRNSATIPDSASKGELFSTHTHTQPHSHTATQPHTHTHTRARARAHLPQGATSKGSHH